MTQDLYLISEVAQRLDVPPHRIAYLLMTRKLDEPKLRMGNRRVFTNDEAKRVADALGLTWVSGGKDGE
jgi:DNA-binding transcriptional MerR regulator